MPGSPVRGLHDDVAAVEMNRSSVPSARDGNLRTFVHLDLRAVRELNFGTRTLRGAELVPISKLVSGANQTTAAACHVEDGSIGAGDSCARHMLTRQKSDVAGEYSDGDSGGKRSQKRPLQNRTVLAFDSTLYRNWRTGVSSRVECMAAGDALMKVIFHQ